jgi:hypothetical protein
MKLMGSANPSNVFSEPVSLTKARALGVTTHVLLKSDFDILQTDLKSSFCQFYFWVT